MDADVLSWSELQARAGSEMRARRLVREGTYRRLLRGTYVDGVHEDSTALRCAALRRALPDGVALSGRTALWAGGLDVLPRDGTLDVTTRRGTHLLHRPGVRTHTALLPDDELVDLTGGLLAVSAARAFVDVARREPLVEAVAVGDVVLRSGAADGDALAAAVARAAGLRGVLAARAALPHLESRSESQGESRLRMRLVLGGLPRPEAQVDLYDPHGAHVGRIDLVLGGVLLEYDGREQRLRQEVFARDRRRQNRLVELGGELRRYTAVDVRPSASGVLCAEVRLALLRSPGLGDRLQRGPDTLRPPSGARLPTRADAMAAAA